MSDQLPPSNPPATDTNIKPGDPPLSAPRPIETIAYQPVSGWAVAGFATSAFFALLVAASTIVALLQGAPVFFPTWVLSLAVLGIILSFVGQNHVQNSEGTRTGGKLATIGIWLGVVSGLCYFSYFYATRYAQEAQANDFLMTEGPDSGFFPLLRKAGADPTALNAAFLLTRPITARSGNPKDFKNMALINDTGGKDGRGELTHFKESLMPRVLFEKLGEEAEIIPRGVQDWKYESKSYQISRIYSIKTKEVELEMLLTVASTEAEASGQGRKWYLNMQPSASGPAKQHITRYGSGLRVLRFRAREWVEQDWLTQMNGGKTLPINNGIDQTVWKNLVVQDQKPDDMRASLYRLFESSKKDRLKDHLKVITRPDELGFWDWSEGKIRIGLRFRLTLVTNAVPAMPIHDIDGYMFVETRQALDPATFDENSPRPDWTVNRIVFTNSSPPGSGGLPPPR